MKTSVHPDAFDRTDDAARIFRSAAEAGFDGVEWFIGVDSKRTYDAPAEVWTDLRASASKSGAVVSALHAGGCSISQLASPDAAIRQLAMQRISLGLERARWCEASTLIVPTDDESTDADQLPLEESLTRVLDALRQLRFKALTHAVRIACHVISDRLIATPTEARRFLDEVNSPFVGIAMNLSDACIQARVSDWIDSLGHRIAWVSVDAPVGRDDANAPQAVRPMEEFDLLIRESLARIRYNGYVSRRGCGDLVESARQLRNQCGSRD